jgi:hypothetical protein
MRIMQIHIYYLDVRMAIHKLVMKQPSEQILNRDVEFIVRADGKKLGELHISKGAIEWIPNNGRYRRRMP